MPKRARKTVLKPAKRRKLSAEEQEEEDLRLAMQLQMEDEEAFEAMRQWKDSQGPCGESEEIGPSLSKILRMAEKRLEEQEEEQEEEEEKVRVRPRAKRSRGRGSGRKTAGKQKVVKSEDRDQDQDQEEDGEEEEMEEWISSHIIPSVMLWSNQDPKLIDQPRFQFGWKLDNSSIHDSASLSSSSSSSSSSSHQDAEESLPQGSLLFVNKPQIGMCDETEQSLCDVALENCDIVARWLVEAVHGVSLPFHSHLSPSSSPSSSTKFKILVIAGAGMGCDSGLPDYRSVNGFWRAYPPLARSGISIGVCLPFSFVSSRFVSFLFVVVLISHLMSCRSGSLQDAMV